MVEEKQDKSGNAHKKKNGGKRMKKKVGKSRKMQCNLKLGKIEND